MHCAAGVIVIGEYTTGGWEPRKIGAGGVPKAEEERAGGGIASHEFVLRACHT